MIISFHGGKCCGIKHIYNMSTKPEDMHDEIENPEPDNEEYAEPDRHGNAVSSSHNFYYGEAPQETGEARLDRYLRYLDGRRPNGIIEIVLCDFSKPYMQQYNQIPGWEPVLIKRGFKLVNDCYNSNSGNRVFIYHRKTDKE